MLSPINSNLLAFISGLSVSGFSFIIRFSLYFAYKKIFTLQFGKIVRENVIKIGGEGKEFVKSFNTVKHIRSRKQGSELKKKENIC